MANIEAQRKAEEDEKMRVAEERKQIEIQANLKALEDAAKKAEADKRF